jgi:aminoglycoside 3-N-acetyltransferase
MTLLVHSALSRLGWVAGGAQALLLALQDAVTDSGTIVMPTQSGQLSDPAAWNSPPVPEDWWPELREHLPGYDPAATPTRGMGVVPELFRRLPGAQRSAHPLGSFAARGPLATALLDAHPLDCMFGEASPLGRLYDADARVLLIGVDHGNSTALHLAEHRADFAGKHRKQDGAPVLVDGRRRWVTFEDLMPRSDDFAVLGEDFARTGAESRGPVGDGVGGLCGMRSLVDFAVAWMENHR